MTPSTAATTEPSSEPSELHTYLGMAWRRRWLIVALVVLLPAIAYAVSAGATKKYRSNVLVQVQPQEIDTSLFTSSQAEGAPEESIDAVARLIRTTGVAQAAARELRPRPANPRALLDQISVKPEGGAGFIAIEATDSDPQGAADVANAFAAAVVKTRAEKARAQIDATVARLRGSMERLPPTDVSGRRQLTQQIQRLRALRAAQGQNAQVVEPAVPAASAFSPRPLRNTALALVIAVLLAAALVVVLDRLDVRVRDPIELEGLVGASLLSIVPSSAFDSDHLEPEASEAFHTLRASLTYFNIDRRLESVLVTSPLKGDGKTTVAANLARAVAQVGKDVVLVDTDLRHPQVANRLHVPGEAGLGSVLVGERELDDVIQEVEVGGGRLRILPAGPPPPNPSELIASESMRALLTRLSEGSDLVVIDTPPILVVSDAIPLVEHASGVVLVGRMNYTTRDSMQRLATVVRNSHGTILGVVGTGAKHSGLYGYGGYDPSPNGAPGGREPAQDALRARG